jgi:regulator of sigma E protease
VSWLLAFVGFAALIVLHELGHFAAAKAVGMRVERFALFFPPMLFTVRRGETEYGVGAIPLGGYVRISGMNPNEELSPEVAPRAYYAQPPWKRIVVIAAGPAVNFLLAFLIFACIFGFRGAAETTNAVAAVTPKSPAVGVLAPGDRIVAVDGVRGDAEALREQIGTHRCAGEPADGCRAAEPAAVTVVRDGAERTLRIAPAYSAAEGRMLVGFSFDQVLEDKSAVQAAGLSVTTMWEVTKLSVERIVALFYDQQAREEVSGVVGSYKVTQETIERSGFVQTASILGLISLSLAIINMFPFLPLDGGHIFWAVAEKVRGRAIPFRVLERVSVVGFMLVIFLFFIGLTNDIGRLNGEGFGVR